MEPECSICFAKYEAEHRPPLLLDCGHSLCAICLAQLLAEPALRCPFDNSPQKLRPLADFPRNYALLDTISQRRWHCASHHRTVRLFCGECREGLCDTCLGAHNTRHALIDADHYTTETRKALLETLQRCLSLQKQISAQGEEAEVISERLLEEKNIIVLLADNICGNFRKTLNDFQIEFRQQAEDILAPLTNRLLAREGCYADLRKRFLEQNARKIKEVGELSVKAENLTASQSSELHLSFEKLRRSQMLSTVGFSSLYGEHDQTKLQEFQAAMSGLQERFISSLQSSFQKNSGDLFYRVEKFENEFKKLSAQNLFLYN